MYVRSKAAGERVMASLERFLAKRLRLKVNRDKSAVARPWKRKFLGYTVTVARQAEAEGGPRVAQATEGQTSAGVRAGVGDATSQHHRASSTP